MQAIAGAEGATLTDSAAHAIARQAEGSSRDALSILDQASVLGGSEIDDEAVTTLLGAPREEVQHELADAVAVGDAKTIFELVNRLVQDGRDLRTVTSEALGHFRNLLIAKTAPGQADLLDVPADVYERLRIQAEKFTPGELARVMALLLAAQNDMRWTTSPRISLELALVRATIPDTDPNPAGVVARLERLERLADLDPTSVMPAADAAPQGRVARRRHRDPGGGPAAPARAGGPLGAGRRAGPQARPRRGEAGPGRGAAARRQRGHRRRRHAAPLLAHAHRPPGHAAPAHPQSHPGVGHRGVLRRRNDRAGVPSGPQGPAGEGGGAPGRSCGTP